VQFLWAESTKFISVIQFGTELDKRRERSESRSFQTAITVFCFAISEKPRKTQSVSIRIGLHATASKSSSRKACFPQINVSNLFEINETQVKVTVVYPSGNVAIPTLHRLAPSLFFIVI
jgi:hypothetical protein